MSGAAVDPPPADRWLLLLLGLGSLLMLVPVWSVPVPPMVDLPQHAAQLGLWQQLGQPGFPYADQLELNWFVPYLVEYLPGRLLAAVLPPLDALRCLVSAGLIALPWSLWLLLRRVGGDPWWALLGVPLGFGFAFYAGFLAFLLSIPLGLLYLSFVHRYARAPTPRAGVALLLATLGLFFCHALVYGACGLAAAVIVAAHAPSRRALLRRWSPLLATLPLAGLWLLVASGAEPMTRRPLEWDLGPARLPEVAHLLLGPGPLALLLLLGLLVGVALGARRLSRDPDRWAPALLGVALCVLAPAVVFGTAYVHHRFTLLGAVLALAAVEPAPPGPRRSASRGLIAALALCWPLVLAVRFSPLAAEAEGFFEVARSIEAPCEVYQATDPTTLPGVVGDPFIHYAALLQVQRPVLVEPTFCHHFPVLVRYRRGVRDGLDLPPGQADLARYDYVLVHSRRDALSEHPGWFAGRRWRLLARSGSWWLFRPAR